MSVPDELVEVAARGVRRWYPMQTSDSSRDMARAVLSAVSEAGWVRAGDYPATEGTYAVLAERALAERDAARAQAEALAGALDFYSDRDGWLRQWVDGGDRARDALRAFRECRGQGA